MRVLIVLAIIAAVAALAEMPSRPDFAEHMSNFQARVDHLHKTSFARYGSLKRKLNAANAKEETDAATRKLLLSSCSDVLDDEGNMLSYTDLIPQACIDCGYFTAIGVTLPDLTCPPTSGTTTDLPSGSCCNDDTNCATGLVCDLINNVCTKSCDTDADCDGGSWSDLAQCENVAFADYSDSSDLVDVCSFCKVAYECSGTVSFCSVCTDYIGPVDETLVTDADCLYVNVNDTDTDDSPTSSDMDIICTDECIYDCLIEFEETTETIFTCVDDVCGITGLDSSDWEDRAQLMCSTYDGEYCSVLFESFDDDSDDCTLLGCCWYTMFREFAPYFCPDAEMHTCPSAVGAGSMNVPTALAVALSTVAAAVFARL